MAVKVMLAPALANRPAASFEASEAKQRRKEPLPSPVEAAGASAPSTKPARGVGRPKRRKATVFDAQGNEVFITLMCLKCRTMRPLSFFGLRKMADGAIRNQPWCRTCRSQSAPKAPPKLVEAEAAPALAAIGGASKEWLRGAPIDSGALAAQVVAALQGGRG